MRGKRVRRKEILDVHKEKRGYWNLQWEALDGTMRLWKRLCTCFKTDCEMNEMFKQTEI